MNPFRVWIRPLGDLFRVRVDGFGNTNWLLTRLGEDSVFKTAEPIKEYEGSGYCSFQVPCSPGLSPSRFQSLMTAIPSVQLMLGPEE